MTASPPFDFAAETAVGALGDGRFASRIGPKWDVIRGPNGGYIAAIILRALLAAVDDPARSPRSLTIHYTAPPTEGAITIDSTLERVGRSQTNASARVEQDGRLIAIALGAFSIPRAGPELRDLEMPSCPAPESLDTMITPDDAPPIARRWERRWTIGAPPVLGAPTAAPAEYGGWIRLPERQLLEAPAIAAVTDAWLPPIFARTGLALFVPTIDLTIHFRATVPLPAATPDDFVFARFRTGTAAEGFMEEDGEVWGVDGTLLAQSRQLAALVPLDV
jgi:acyl-CoA thioesterase